MYCTRCGSPLAANAIFCSACGQPTNSAPDSALAPSVHFPPVPGFQYAGFWLRLVAYWIDGVAMLLGAIVLLGLFAGPLALLGFFRNFNARMDSANGAFEAGFIGLLIGFAVLFVAGAWLYYAWMESSRHRATLGKMALGLFVADLDGRPVTFGRATGRFFAKVITGLIPFYIGYIMAGFTQRKQTLHDLIAGCLVLRKD